MTRIKNTTDEAPLGRIKISNYMIKLMTKLTGIGKNEIRIYQLNIQFIRA